METPAGWYADPVGVFDHRWWDGAAWTASVDAGGQTGSCPVETPESEARAVADQLRAGAAPSSPPPPVPAWPTPTSSDDPPVPGGTPDWRASSPGWTPPPAASPPGGSRGWVVPVSIGAVVLLILLVVGAMAVLRGGGSPDDDGADVSVFELTVGTCFDDVAAFGEQGGGEVGDLPVVECDAPHDNEVYAVFNVEESAFPGDEAMRETAEEGCLARFEPYVDRDYDSSRLVISHLVPTDGTWARGDREVICFLYDIDLEKLVGSMEGSEQ